MPAKLPALLFVRSGLTQGLSANAAFREYQTAAADAGFTASRRQDFLRLYSQTSRLRGQASEAIDAPKDLPNGGLRPVQRDTVRARGLGYWVSVFQVNRETGGFESTPFLVKSYEALTPAEAEQRAIDFLQTQSERYNRRLLGVTFSGVESFNPSETL